MSWTDIIDHRDMYFSDTHIFTNLTIYVFCKFLATAQNGMVDLSFHLFQLYINTPPYLRHINDV